MCIGRIQNLSSVARNWGMSYHKKNSLQGVSVGLTLVGTCYMKEIYKITQLYIFDWYSKKNYMLIIISTLRKSMHCPKEWPYRTWKRSSWTICVVRNRTTYDTSTTILDGKYFYFLRFTKSTYTCNHLYFDSSHGLLSHNTQLMIGWIMTEITT